MGTGTGKLAQALLDAAPAARVVGVDFTFGMLRVAPRGLSLAAADALRLPFADGQFDAIVSASWCAIWPTCRRGSRSRCASFGLAGGWSCSKRRPGRRGCCGRCTDCTFRHVVPLLGRLIAGDGTAYTYLPESTLAFLEPARLADLLRQQGLVDVDVRAAGAGQRRGYVRAEGPLCFRATGGTL